VNKEIYNEEIYNEDIYNEETGEEMWDACDVNGNKLGYELPRSMAKNLPQGVYHVVVNVYTITKKGRILVTQRSKNKTYPLKWEVTGGSVLSGETALHGAVRELREETGIIATEDELVELYYYTDHKRHCIYHSYLVVFNREPKITLQPGETMDYQYMDYKAFKSFVRTDRFVPSEQHRYMCHENQIDAKISKKLNQIETN
jgi:8-oxo-dGTP pyrophosphatase MutT (NUDIX family)